MYSPFLISFLTFLATFLALNAPGWAQSERYPTEAEIDTLIQQMRQNIPELMGTGIYDEWRTAEERDAWNAYTATWADWDAMAAPFLGEWFAIEESLAIFPMPTPGQVCIIDTYLDESLFYFGQVVGSNLYTDINLVFALDSGFLGSTFIYDGKAGLYEYANPKVPVDPRLTYLADYHPDVVDQFEMAGCLTQEPEAEESEAKGGLDLSQSELTESTRYDRDFIPLVYVEVNEFRDFLEAYVDQVITIDSNLSFDAVLPENHLAHEACNFEEFMTAFYAEQDIAAIHIGLPQFDPEIEHSDLSVTYRSDRMVFSPVSAHEMIDCSDQLHLVVNNPDTLEIVSAGTGTLFMPITGQFLIEKSTLSDSARTVYTLTER